MISKVTAIRHKTLPIPPKRTQRPQLRPRQKKKKKTNQETAHLSNTTQQHQLCLTSWMNRPKSSIDCSKQRERGGESLPGRRGFLAGEARTTLSVFFIFRRLGGGLLRYSFPAFAAFLLLFSLSVSVHRISRRGDEVLAARRRSAWLRRARQLLRRFQRPGGDLATGGSRSEYGRLGFGGGSGGSP